MRASQLSCLIIIYLVSAVIFSADADASVRHKHEEDIQRLLRQRDAHTTSGLMAENAARKAAALAEQFSAASTHYQYQQAQKIAAEQKRMATKDFNAAKEEQQEVEKIQEGPGYHFSTATIEDAAVLINEHLTIVLVAISLIILGVIVWKLQRIWATRNNLKACKESLLNPSAKQASDQQGSDQVHAAVRAAKRAGAQALNPHRNMQAKLLNPEPEGEVQEFTQAEKRNLKIEDGEPFKAMQEKASRDPQGADQLSAFQKPERLSSTPVALIPQNPLSYPINAAQFYSGRSTEIRSSLPVTRSAQYQPAQPFATQYGPGQRIVSGTTPRTMAPGVVNPQMGPVNPQMGYPQYAYMPARR